MGLMPNVYHVSSPSASLFSSTQQAGWYSTGIFYKGFDRIDGFISSSKNLSGIVFKTIWVSLKRNYNLVWCNRNAEQQIPQELKEYMTNMGRT
jgi:hypothetical protein